MKVGYSYCDLALDLADSMVGFGRILQIWWFTSTSRLYGQIWQILWFDLADFGRFGGLQ